MRKKGPVVPLVAAMLVTLVLVTVVADGAWVLWLPVLLALGVVARLWYAVTH